MNNAASLSKLKKDELVDLCKQHGITGYSKLKKDELVALLTDKLGEQSAPAAEAEPAAEKPAEKKAPAKKCCRTRKACADSDLSRCCTALVNLWGIAPVPLVAAVYNFHHDASVTNEEVTAAATCPVVDGELLHESLVGKDEVIASLRKKQAAYHHYVPTLTHIDDYLDENFRENTHEFTAMCDYMVRTFKMSKEDARKSASEILQYLDDEFDINRLMGTLAGSGIRFEDDTQFRNFALLMNKMKSTARFWGFCGHTHEEAANFTHTQGTIHTYKVGRNDPCPCGSGKKYKKCCGR